MGLFCTVQIEERIPMDMIRDPLGSCSNVDLEVHGAVLGGAGELENDCVLATSPTNPNDECGAWSCLS